jgi:hypothetical protein
VIKKDTPDPGGEFDRELRAWGLRPPSTDPTRAARRVLAALPAGHHRQWAWRLATAAALCVTLAVTVFIVTSRPSTHPNRMAQADAPAPLDERVVQFWIDPQTPVYFVLSPLGSDQGDNS